MIFPLSRRLFFQHVLYRKIASNLVQSACPCACIPSQRFARSHLIVPGFSFYSNS